MQPKIRLFGMRPSVTGCATLVLMFATLFSLSSPVVGAEVTATPSPPVNSITVSESQPRWIEIDLSEQKLYAWEGENLIYSFRISTGKSATPTPTGKFLIGVKYRTDRMRGRDYNIPDVPYVMYFYKGYAIHGAYWHNKFGTPISHGCVNLRVKQARQLYNWATVGMRVVVHQ